MKVGVKVLKGRPGVCIREKEFLDMEVPGSVQVWEIPDYPELLVRVDLGEEEEEE